MYKFYHVTCCTNDLNHLLEADVKQTLISFYYIKKDKKLLPKVLENNMEVVIDSGLFSYSNGKDINEKEAIQYCEEYIRFVKEYHNDPRIINFFELDFDLIGFDYETFVKPYQKRLVEITDKIVLITQKRRTVEDIECLLEQNVTTIAIPFASSVERKWFDYMYIIEKAHKKGKRVHLLGCSAVEFLIYADQSDSSSWVTSAVFGNQIKFINGKIKSFYIPKDENQTETTRRLKTENAQEFLKLEPLVNQKVKNEERYEVLRLF